MKRLVGRFMVVVAVAVVIGVFAVPASAQVFFANCCPAPAVVAPTILPAAPVAPAVYSPVGFTATVVPTCYPTTVNYFTSPVRLGGDWTYNQYNPWTRTHNQVVDVGLTASGQAPITYTNATGGWTMLKSMGRR